MKIIQLVFTLSSGGAEKFVVNLSNQLAEMGHDVTIVQLRNDENGEGIYFNKEFISPQINYINLGLTKGFKLSKAIRVMKKIVSLSPDIVHSHLNVLPYYYPLALFSKKIKFVHTLHNVAHKETQNKWQQIINKFIYKTKLITPVTISKECQKSFTSLYGITNPICIDNGCPIIKPTLRFNDTKNEIGEYRQTNDSKIFIHIARCSEAKNQNVLIEVFKRLISNGIDVELIILGTGFDSPKGKELKKIACGRIHFLGPRTNIGDYLLNSHYFILSSLWEGLPISLIEAMSAKVTPICTPAGGIPNVITDGFNGFLSNDFTPDSLYETVIKALHTPLNKEAIYKSYIDGFSMEKCASEYEKVYLK